MLNCDINNIREVNEYLNSDDFKNRVRKFEVEPTIQYNNHDPDFKAPAVYIDLNHNSEKRTALLAEKIIEKFKEKFGSNFKISFEDKYQFTTLNSRLIIPFNSNNLNIMRSSIKDAFPLSIPIQKQQKLQELKSKPEFQQSLNNPNTNPILKGNPEIVLDKNVKGKTEQELIEYLQEKYPEIKLNITNNPVWEQGDNVFNQEEFNKQVSYRLKATEILSSDKAKQVFEKGKKNGWDLNKILTELQISKEQKQLILDLGIVENKPNVILPIGTSGSGKSTFIKSLPQENLVVIEPDAMRVEFTGDMNDKSKDKEIYVEAANRAIKAIKQGKQVVFDTTNLTKDKRLPFIEAIKKAIPTANIQYKLMELNPELAKQRIKADIAAGKNRANVPDSTIDRHAESYNQMLEDIKSEPVTEFKDTDLREQIALKLASNYSYTVEINTAKTPRVGEKFLDREYGYELEVTEETLQNQINDGFVDNNLNTQYYSNLTVPGGTNYTENEISIPGQLVEEKPQGVPVKEGVQELFDSNPELANAVYEAIGFKKVYHGSKTTEKYSEYKVPVNKGVDSLGTFFTSDINAALLFTPDFIDESPIAKDVRERTGKVSYKKDRSYVKEEYLKLQNPYTVDIKKWEDNSWLNDFVEGDFSNYNFNEVPSNVVDTVKKILIDKGHDGIYIAKNPYAGNYESNYDQYIVFNPNKTLEQQKQQAQQLYSQYLDMVFPDSKVKDIVYHGSNQKIEQFEVRKEPLIHFGTKNAALQRGNILHQVLLNVKDLQTIKDGMWFLGTDEGGLLKELLDRNILTIEEVRIINDAKNKAIRQSPYFNENYRMALPEGEKAGNKKLQEILKDKNIGFEYINFSEDKGSTSYAVPNQEQVHILGSKQDIEGFKSFIKSNTKTVRKGAITPSIKGHAAFSTDSGIGWFRGDEKQNYTEQDIDSLIDNMKKSGVLEINCS